MKKLMLILFLLLATIHISNAQAIKAEWVVCNNNGCKVLDPYYSEGVTMKWEGDCIAGKANGFGTLTKFKNGEYESTYEGEYKNGIREGKGKFTHADGTAKTGTFVDGQMVGEGLMIYEDGSKYVGNFINYTQHGLGVLYYSDGDQYIGFFVSDELYTGKIISKDGKITYIQNKKEVNEINEVKSNYRPELGIKTTEYFDKYFRRCSKENYFFYREITYQLDHKPSDTVRVYYSNGQLYAKAFAVYLDYDDEGKSFYEGDAVYYFQDGKIKQKLRVLNNKVDGIETTYYPDGQMASQESYSGGLRNGICKEWYPNGILKSIGIFEDEDILSSLYLEYDENGHLLQ